VRAGSGDVTALVGLMAKDGIARPLHLAGREHRVPADTSVTITRRIAYAADPVAELPSAARAALARDAIALIHSPRAAAIFAALLGAAGIDSSTIAIAAISEAAAIGNWKAVAIAATPDDSALLAAAAGLCEKG
jgi:uroporphyrinogen-III synthase